MKWLKRISFLVLLGCIHCSKAQENKVFQDVRLLVKETTKAVTVVPGQVIDTAYFRTLFLPSAHFTVVGEENGKRLHETMSLNEFIGTLRDSYYTNGYKEVSKGMILEEYNGIAQVLQSFYGEDSDGEKAWGVNSYHLIYSKNRWWITDMIWTMSPKGKEGIPRKLLKN